MRRAFSTGGETLTWARRERKLKPRPLVLICDVSGSMERYTRLLLQFLHTVSHGVSANVETFVFATRLTRVTPSLRRRRVDEALDRVAQEVADWSGRDAHRGGPGPLQPGVGQAGAGTGGGGPDHLGRLGPGRPAAAGPRDGPPAGAPPSA